MSDHNNEIPLNEGWQLNRPQETRGQALTNSSQIHLTPSNITPPPPPPPSVPQNKKQRGSASYMQQHIGCISFWCRFEGFNACDGGVRQAAPFCACSLADVHGGALLNHRRNHGCNLFHASMAFCINRRYISSLLKDIFDDSSSTIIILGESY